MAFLIPKWSKFVTYVSAFQIMFIIIFGFYAEYPDDAKPHDKNTIGNEKAMDFYPAFQDIHVMIFIGFGYLMTFLKRYGYSSLGFNFLLGAFVIQWSTVINGFLFHEKHEKIVLNPFSLINADFTCGSILISFGAVLGKLNPLQLLFMATTGTVFKLVSEWICIDKLMISDVGGSITIHMFGAYFGLAVSLMLFKRYKQSCTEAIYHSDLFAMIGTVFLFMFWPSFNSVVAATEDGKFRAVIHTYFSMSASCVGAFIISYLVNKGKFDMVHIQNATLAGGVAIGTCADLYIGAWSALLIGLCAGVFSVLLYYYVAPILNSKLKLHDTCGVNNLHGLPGLFSGILGSIFAKLADETDYKTSLYEIYKARAPRENTLALQELNANSLKTIEPGENRTASQQALFQLAAIAVTLGIAVVGGCLTGLLLRLNIWNESEYKEKFDDATEWIIEDPGMHSIHVDHLNVSKETFVGSNGNASRVHSISENTHI